MSSTKGNVLIAGAGPTGMMAALELTRQGIGVRLIERAAEPATTSRAIGVQARTLELFEQRGLLHDMLPHGNPASGGSVYGGGKRLFRLDFSRLDSVYNYIFFISQALTEQALRNALAQMSVQIERRVELLAIAQTDRADTLTAILKLADGSLENLQCDYLIDAEGAHSVARPTSGLEFEGRALATTYALGDLYIDGDLSGSDLHIFSSDSGFLALFPMGNRRFRLIAADATDGSTPEADTPPTAPTLEALQSIVDSRSHIPVQLRDMSWSSWFHINSRMVPKLRAGRVLLGGDSAHIHSPAGAQGMNTGLQDMVNLSWKLAAVLKGEAHPKLLDTYDADRIPVIRSIVKRTEGLTEAIGTENAMFRSFFSHVTPWLVGTDVVQENATMQMSQLALGYRNSSLSENRYRSSGLHAGDRVPDIGVRLVSATAAPTEPGESVTLFKLLDPSKWVLLYSNLADARQVRQEAGTELAPWLHLLTEWEIADPGDAAHRDDRYRAALGSEPALVLVRPDGYVGFTGGARSVTALKEYLDTWLVSTTKPGSAS
jgi:2-polyprenyl-6-methoxyphenol hydroxylase-like FAD-dependent oxidoreductase